MGKFSHDEDLKAPSVSSPESAHWLYTASVKLHLRDRRTKRHVSSFVRPFVCLFVRCVCQGRPSYGEMNRYASQKFKGGGNKIQDQPLNTRSLVS